MSAFGGIDDSDIICTRRARKLSGSNSDMTGLHISIYSPMIIRDRTVIYLKTQEEFPELIRESFIKNLNIHPCYSGSQPSKSDANSRNCMCGLWNC